MDRGYGVIGRDDGLSVRIGSNCCYFFGDTVLTQANSQGSSWVGNTMYHTTNTNGDTGVSGGYNWLGNGVPPIQFIPYTADETNWIATNSHRYVYGIWPNGQFYSPGDSNQYITIGKVIEEPGGGIPDVGMGLAICPTNPINNNATRVQSRPGNAQPYLMWDASEGDWGDMCCTMSNYVYFYWVNGTNYGTLYVARASLLGNPPAFLTKTNWQYWNGSTWVTNSPSSAAYLFAGVGIGTIDWNAFLTNGSGGRGCYLFTCMSWVSNEIDTRTSSDLVHWSAVTAQYTAPVNWPSGSFPYFGRAAKCLEKNNGQTIYISWSLPNTNLAKPENLPMIRAQFPMVTPVFSGLTVSQSIDHGTSSVTLTGTVSAAGAYPATGETITVTINGNAQTTTVNDSTGDFSIKYNPSSLPAIGTAYAITYSYAGDGALNPATNASSTLTVNKASTSVGVHSSGNPSLYGEGVSFTATLPVDATGDVVFRTNGMWFDTEALSDGLAASVATSLLPSGTNTLTAEYAGDGNYLGSTNALPGGQVVTNPPPVVGVTAAISLQSNGIVSITFMGNPYESYVVQAATNLTGPWQPVSTNMAGGDGSWQLTEPDATNGQQYFKVSSPVVPTLLLETSQTSAGQNLSGTRGHGPSELRRAPRLNSGVIPPLGAYPW